MLQTEKQSIIIIGESSVGKTSILYKYTQGYFTGNHLATIGLEYFTKEQEIDGKKIRIKFWDTSGQEQFKSLTRNFYKDADGVLVVYDVSNRDSFKKVGEWIESVYDNSNSDVKMILVGNKIDLHRDVSKEEGLNLAKEYKLNYHEMSAKDGTGIEDAIKDIISLVLQSNKIKNENLKLINDKKQEVKSCGC